MVWKLAFANIRHRGFRAELSALLIAISLIPVLLAAGFGQRPAVAPSDSSVTAIALTQRPEGATFRPLFRRFAAAFLIACAAITFLSARAQVPPRKREIGVLRSLGASKALVIAIFFTEAATVSLGGAVFAILITQSFLAWLNYVSAATPPYSIGFQWFLAAISTVIGAAMIGSTIPCLVSVQQDVLDMLEWDR